MAAGRRIRVLIVDDSVVMRSLLRTVVSADAGLEVAATAADGEAALRTIASGAFDLILLDVEMPVMDGLATLRQLRIRGYKMPVIMCSSLTQRGGRVTIEALAGGASDYVAKPSGQGGREAAIQALSQELIPKIHALTQSPTAPAQPPHIFSGLGPGPGSGFGSGPGSTLPPGMGSGPPPGLASGLAPGLAPVLPPGFGPGSVLARAPQLLPAPQFPSLTLSPRQPFSVSAPTVLVIGVSTGGPAALDVILPSLPAGFPLPVLIVQHMPEVFTRLLAERLNGRCRLRAKEAADGDAVRPGTIFIARGNWHMEVLAASRLGACASLRLNQNAPENHCRPSC
jgi:two-component system chemotaxis response regulator CheB